MLEIVQCGAVISLNANTRTHTEGRESGRENFYGYKDYVQLDVHVQCMCTIFPTYTVMNYFVLYKVLLISKHCLATVTRGLGMEVAPFLQVGERIGIATAIAIILYR